MAQPLARTEGTMFDHELMLRDTTDGCLDGNETGAAVAIYSTAQRGATVKICVPSGVASGVGSFVAGLEASPDTVAWAEIARSEPISDIGEYDYRFGTQRDYVRLNFTVSGQGDWGLVIAGVVNYGV